MNLLHEQALSQRRNRWWSLSVASLATLIVTADTGQLSIAMPLIINEFNADLTLASWLTLIYALVTASLYLPCGRLSDLFGIGKLFLAGFILYALSSFAAGSSHGTAQLIFFRALQAVGSALIMANNFALVTALFPPEERGRAMGIAGGTVSALGYTMGPVLGGLLTHSFGWRANFYVSAVLACAGFAAARILLPPESFKAALSKKEPFDFSGAFAFALSVSLLLFALAMAQKAGGGGLPVALITVGGIGALGFFLWWEKRLDFPLLDLNLFRIAAFTLGNSTRLISFITMSISTLLVPFFLQLVMELDPLRAGFLVAPTPFAMALLAPLTGWMSEKFVAERLCSIGLAVNGFAFVFLSYLTAAATPLQIVVGLALVGVGMGLFQTPNNNLLMSSVPRNRLGVGSSVLSIVRSLGYSIGAASGAMIVSSQIAALTGQTSLQFSAGQLLAGGGAAARAGFLYGFRLALLSAAALCFLGAALSLVRVSKEFTAER